MCKKFTVWCQKGAFAGGMGAVSIKRAPPWVKGALSSVGGRGAVSAYKGAVVGKNSAFSARKAPSLAGAASYLLKNTQSCAERSLFRARRTCLLADGAPFQLRGRHYTRKGVFFVTEGRLC